jgi:hypothetical protein
VYGAGSATAGLVRRVAVPSAPPMKRPLRRIHVAGLSFHWWVRRADPGHVRLCVQVARHRSAQRLEVRVRSDDFWLALGDPDIENRTFRVVTPRLVRAVIERAAAQGWSPEEPGPPQVFELT